MTHTDRVRVVFHGGIVMLVGLLCGYPTVSESIAGGESTRLWHTAHEVSILTSVLMLAMSSVFPLLGLGRREAQGLVWSLIAAGYGLTVGTVLGAIRGAPAFGPSGTPLGLVAFGANAVGILGSMLAALLTVVGARAARRVAESPGVESL